MTESQNIPSLKAPLPSITPSFSPGTLVYTLEDIQNVFGKCLGRLATLNSTISNNGVLSYMLLFSGIPNFIGQQVYAKSNKHLLLSESSTSKHVDYYPRPAMFSYPYISEAIFPVFLGWGSRDQERQYQAWCCLGWFRLSAFTYLEPCSNELLSLLHRRWGNTARNRLRWLEDLAGRWAVIAIVPVKRMEGHNPMQGVEGREIKKADVVATVLSRSKEEMSESSSKGVLTLNDLLVELNVTRVDGIAKQVEKIHEALKLEKGEECGDYTARTVKRNYNGQMDYVQKTRIHIQYEKERGTTKTMQNVATERIIPTEVSSLNHQDVLAGNAGPLRYFSHDITGMFGECFGTPGTLNANVSNRNVLAFVLLFLRGPGKNLQNTYRIFSRENNHLLFKSNGSLDRLTADWSNKFADLTRPELSNAVFPVFITIQPATDSLDSMGSWDCLGWRRIRHVSFLKANNAELNNISPEELIREPVADSRTWNKDCKVSWAAIQLEEIPGLEWDNPMKNVAGSPQRCIDGITKRLREERLRKKWNLEDHERGEEKLGTDEKGQEEEVGEESHKAEGRKDDEKSHGLSVGYTVHDTLWDDWSASESSSEGKDDGILETNNAVDDTGQPLQEAKLYYSSNEITQVFGEICGTAGMLNAVTHNPDVLSSVIVPGSSKQRGKRMQRQDLTIIIYVQNNIHLLLSSDTLYYATIRPPLAPPLRFDPADISKEEFPIFASNSPDQSFSDNGSYTYLGWYRIRAAQYLNPGSSEQIMFLVKNKMVEIMNSSKKQILKQIWQERWVKVQFEKVPSMQDHNPMVDFLGIPKPKPIRVVKRAKDVSLIKAHLKTLDRCDKQKEETGSLKGKRNSEAYRSWSVSASSSGPKNPQNLLPRPEIKSIKPNHPNTDTFSRGGVRLNPTYGETLLSSGKRPRKQSNTPLDAHSSATAVPSFEALTPQPIRNFQTLVPQPIVKCTHDAAQVESPESESASDSVLSLNSPYQDSITIRPQTTATTTAVDHNDLWRPLIPSQNQKPTGKSNSLEFGLLDLSESHSVDTATTRAATTITTTAIDNQDLWELVVPSQNHEIRGKLDTHTSALLDLGETYSFDAATNCPPRRITTADTRDLQRLTGYLQVETSSDNTENHSTPLLDFEETHSIDTMTTLVPTPIPNASIDIKFPLTTVKPLQIKLPKNGPNILAPNPTLLDLPETENYSIDADLATRSNYLNMSTCPNHNSHPGSISNENENGNKLTDVDADAISLSDLAPSPWLDPSAEPRYIRRFRS